MARHVQQKLESVLETFANSYAAAFSAAPKLPNPPDEGFEFITAAGLRKEAREVAPLNGPAIAARGHPLAGRLMRLQNLRRKAVEFRLFHLRRHQTLSKYLKVFQYLILLIAMLSTVLLLGFPATSWCSTVATLGSILLCVLACWSRFAAYETRAEGHLLASNDFEGVSRDIGTYMSQLKPDNLDDDLKTLSLALESNALLHEVQHQQYQGPGPVAEAREHDADATTTRNARHHDKSHVQGQKIGVQVAVHQVAAEDGMKAQAPLTEVVVEPQRQAIKKPTAAALVQNGGSMQHPTALAAGAPRSIPPLASRPQQSLPSSPGTGSHGQTLGADDLGRNMQLQRWFHKAAEYRRAHSIFAERNRMYSMWFGFTMLLLSFSIQILLLASSARAVKTVAAFVAALITLLVAIQAKGNFDGKAQEHAVSMRKFITLENNIATVLMALTSDQEEKEFRDVSVEFSNAINGMPVLPVHYLAKQKEKDGSPRFEHISEAALQREAQADHSLEALASLLKAQNHPQNGAAAFAPASHAF